MFLDGLYSVENLSETEATVLLSDETHPVFKAHFPSQPILPGFVHLEIISNIFKMNIQGVKKAKYMGLVLPSQRVKYIKKSNKIRVTCNDKDVASFSLV